LSQASERRGWHRKALQKKLKKLDEAIEEILKQTEQAASDSGGETQLPAELQQRQQLRELIAAQLKQLDEKKRDHLQPADEDARVMKTTSGKDFAYNAQIVVDQESKLIVASDVVTDESDNAQLVPMIEQVQHNVGGTAQETLADGGYFATVELAGAEGKKFSVLVNLPESVTGSPNQPYHASRFVYDSNKDHCICPRGIALPFASVLRRDKARPYKVRLYRCQSYETCPVRWQCSASKTGRTVQIHPNHDALVRQREKLKDPAMRAKLKQRGGIVEGVFGWFKEGMGFRRWTVRGQEKVKTQWSLLCVAVNLQRLYTPWFTGKLRFA
jgi:vacuolar-type H+-ATPase subunit E/Vma4